MIFAQNSLRLVNGSGGSGIEFTALDALKRVDTQHDTVQVANAKQWKEARYVPSDDRCSDHVHVSCYQ